MDCGGDVKIPAAFILDASDMNEDRKQCRKCEEVKPLEQFYSAGRGRLGRASECKVCVLETKRVWREANLEKAKTIAKASFLRHKERRNQESRDYYSANKDLVAQKSKDLRENDPEANVERRRQYYAKNRERLIQQTIAFQNARPGFRAKLCAARRAQKKKAMPPWADRRAIADVYQDAKELSVATDMIWHVDHIIPLKHPHVCGLHIAANLQIMPADENQRKSNRFEPIQEVYVV